MLTLVQWQGEMEARMGKYVFYNWRKCKNFNCVSHLLCFTLCSLTSIQDSHIPPVLSRLVDSFQKFMKQQKETSDEISHFSDKAMKKVKQDTIAQAEVWKHRMYQFIVKVVHRCTKVQCSSVLQQPEPLRWLGVATA